MSLLDQFRKDTVLDLDCNDDQVAVAHGPFGNMTSNQAIVLNELVKPENLTLIQESAAQARKDISDKTENADIVQLTVDWMTVKLGAKVLPHLDVKGYVLAQTNPSFAYSTDDTVAHAQRIVRLYGRAGIPQGRIAIKIPSTLQGLRACRTLEKEHDIRALATTVFCAEQALAAAEEAGCIYCSPYVNPLHVHFVPGTHVVYKDPITEMKGMKVTALVQREYRKRGIRTQVLAASLITLEETLCLSGVDRVTLGPSMLDQMVAKKETEAIKDLRSRAMSSYDPEFDAADGLPADAHFPLDEPAVALKAALERPDIKELLADALHHFGNAEKQLAEVAKKALG